MITPNINYIKFINSFIEQETDEINIFSDSLNKTTKKINNFMLDLVKKGFLRGIVENTLIKKNRHAEITIVDSKIRDYDGLYFIKANSLHNCIDWYYEDNSKSLPYQYTDSNAYQLEQYINELTGFNMLDFINDIQSSYELHFYHKKETIEDSEDIYNALTSIYVEMLKDYYESYLNRVYYPKIKETLENFSIICAETCWNPRTKLGKKRVEKLYKELEDI
jgi:hypothetical protein